MLARAGPVRAVAAPRALARTAISNAASRSGARNASTAAGRSRSRAGRLAGAAAGLGASLALLGVVGADDAASAPSKALGNGPGQAARPVWKRDELSTVLVIGAPKSGASTVADAISRRFDMLLLDAESDAFTDIAKQRAMNRHERLHVVIDNFDPDQLAWYTSEIGHVLLIVFVDTPIDSAVQRVSDKRVAAAIPEQHKAWERLTADVIAEYRHRGNFLEISGHWPADEVWEQVEAKLESALELEDRGEL